MRRSVAESMLFVAFLFPEVWSVSNLTDGSLQTLQAVTADVSLLSLGLNAGPLLIRCLASVLS